MPRSEMNSSKFQSTLPLRGATMTTCSRYPARVYFNPHSPCGERLGVVGCEAVADVISIHTPLAGSDRRNETFLTK